MTKNSLVNLTVLANQLESQLMESGGELTPELEQALEQLKQDLPAKVDQIDYAMDRLEAMEALWKKREEECKKVRQAFGMAQDRLKDTIRWAAANLQTNEIKGNLKRIKLTPTERLEIDSEKVPVSYKDVEMIMKPNSLRIKEAISAGKDVEGAKIVKSFAVRFYVNKNGDKTNE